MSGPRTKAGIFSAADRLARQGRHRDAIGAYRDILADRSLRKRDPLACELAHWGMAELLILEREGPEAEKHLLIAIELNPNEANYYQQLGSLYCYMDRFEEAVQQLNKSLAIRPSHPITMHLLGRAVFMAGDLQNGRKILERALALDECNVGALNDLAVCLVELRQYDQALKHLDRALEMDPHNKLLSSYRQMVIVKKASF
jgi:superkiller protein 3